MTLDTNRLARVIAERRRRRRIRTALLRLDERALWDIGMNRADIDIRYG